MNFCLSNYTDIATSTTAYLLIILQNRDEEVSTHATNRICTEIENKYYDYAILFSKKRRQRAIALTVISKFLPDSCTDAIHRVSLFQANTVEIALQNFSRLLQV